MSAIQQLLTEHIDIWTGADAAKRTGRGRASGNASSVYGVKKLRELILELAVRGKLVPQDPKDEPASELLKRIQAEKEKLVNAGKIKKDKPLAKIAEEEKPFELPSGWEWVRFGNLVNICTGKLDANAAVENGKYPFFTCSQTPSKIDTYSFDTAAVLLAGNGDFNVKFYEGRFDAYQRTYVIEPVLCDLKFCFVLVTAQIGEITKNNRGSAIAYLKIGDLTDPVFALPPIAEQHRIVAKVDELMALCDQLEAQHNNAAEAHEKIVCVLLQALTQSADATAFADNWQRIAVHFDTLFTTEASIDALKQTLLQLAVMGKLVPQDTNDEPACELLKKIRAEKDKLIKEGKIKKDKPLAAIAEDEKPFWLPKGWALSRWNNVAIKIGDIDHKMPETVSNGVPYVSPRDFYPNNMIDFDGAKQVSREDYLRLANKIKPDMGDLIYPRYGTIGENRLVEVQKDFLASYSCAVIKTMKIFINEKYQYIFSISNYCKLQAKAAENKTTQANVGIASIQSYIIPIPPLAEQNRIVAKVDELMALCDQLKTRIGEAGKLQQKIADVVVERAI